MSDETLTPDGGRDARIKRFIMRKLLVRLRYNEMLADYVDELAADDKLGAEFGKQFIDDLSVRRRELASVRWRLIIYSSMPVFLLFLSLVGVKWEAQALGIHLTDLQRIKEIILVVATCLTGYASLLEYKDYILKCIIEGLGTRLLSKEVFEIYRFRLPTGFPHEFDLLLNLKKSRLLATGRVGLLFLPLALTVILSLVLFTAVSFIPSLYVAYDVWVNPSWPTLVSKCVVVACVLVWLSCLAFSLALFFKYSFLDMRKFQTLLQEIVEDRERLLNEALKE